MARGPQAIGDVLGELMARRGFARVQTASAYEAAWREASGPLLARYTRVGALRRGILEVIAANSMVVQELGFQKSVLLRNLADRLPDEGIEGLRFRVGNIE